MRTRDHGLGAFNAAAVSLLELVMLMAIMGLASTVVAPRLSGMLDQRSLEMEARRIKQDLIFAQQSAITRQRAYRVRFDLMNERYTISYDPANINNFTDIRTYTLTNNVLLTGTDFLFPSPNTIQFDSFGTPSSNGNIYLAHGSDSLLVNVAPTTGKVEIR